MRVRHPINVFAVGEVRISLANFTDLKLWPIDGRMSFSVFLSRGLNSLEFNPWKGFSSSSVSTQRVRDYISKTAGIMQSTIDELYLLDDIVPPVHARLSNIIHLSTTADAPTLAEVEVVDNLFRANCIALCKPEEEVLDISTFNTEILIVHDMAPADCLCKLITIVPALERVWNITKHKQYIDGKMGIPGRLNVAPMPLAPKSIEGILIYKNNRLNLKMPLGLNPQVITSGMSSLAQRVREYLCQSDIKCVSPILSIIRFTLIKLAIQPHARIDWDVNVIAQPPFNTDLHVAQDSIRIQLLRGGLPGAPITFDPFSAVGKYRHIVIPYVAEI